MTSDDDLLRRFAALRSGQSTALTNLHETTGTSNPGPSRHIAAAERKALEDAADLERIAEGRPLDPDSDWGRTRGAFTEKQADDAALQARYEGVRGQRSGWTPAQHDTPDDDNDVDVEAFLSSLSASGPAKPLSARDDQPSENVDEEVARLLRETEASIKPPNRHQADAHDEGESEHDDGETEAEILERALAEAALERDSDTADLSAEDAPQVPVSSQRDRRSESTDLSFPILPTHQLESDTNGGGETADPGLEARMTLLLGLSGPSAAPSGPKLPSAPKVLPSSPSSEKQPGQGYNLPGWADGRDEDIDSWCCICNKDATIQCIGCDDDLYCDECWRDGHGPGGEQGHRAKRFVWGKGRRRLDMVS